MKGIVIIVGAARSGTKYLRDIVSSSEAVAKVPYDVNYVWRTGNEAWPDDAIPVERASAGVSAFIRGQIRRLSGQNADRLVLEKTVGTSLRVPFAAAVFPEARFIHLIRDGRAVAESAMRQWTAPPDWPRLLDKVRQIPLRNWGYIAWFARNWLRGKALGRGGGSIWGPRYSGIAKDVEAGTSLATICARQWRMSVEAATRDLAALPAGRVHTLRYEELVAGDSALRELCEFIGLPDTDRVIEQHRSLVDRTTGDKWRLRLADDQLADIDRELGDTAAKLGYRRQEPA